MHEVTIIGAGIAGSEAAWQLAERGVHVRLQEMRPLVMSPAHHTQYCAELVCSNSLKSTNAASAAGLLKEELRSLGSFILAVAEEHQVAAGAALAVDREAFSRCITERLEAHPLIALERREVVSMPEGDVIVAAGPLPSPAFQEVLARYTLGDHLAFYDAAAPIIDACSIDMTQVFSASRWAKGSGADYLNCPLDRESYERLVTELVGATRVELKAFERGDLFQSCQPIEEVARSGLDALRFGALRPIGLIDPRTGERPWAVVQLRPENREHTAYNLVGFQTNLTFAEQRRVFRLIPGLEHAEFFRHGVMHRNTFINAPQLLTPGLALRSCSRVRIAGQLTGTEGYLEAAATGLVAALDVWASGVGCERLRLPVTSALGSLLAYVTSPDTSDYQPMHVNFGLVPPLTPGVRGKQNRYAAYALRAKRDFAAALGSQSASPLFSTASGAPAGMAREGEKQ